MSVDVDVKLTELAAGILRDAVQVYDSRESEAMLARFNPVLATWNTGVFVGPGATESLPAVTGSLSSRAGTGLRPTAGEATSAFRAVTSSFRAITESFLAVGQEPSAPSVTLRRVFRLPHRLPGVRLAAEPELAATARSAPTMAHLDALAQWLGKDGRLVTTTGSLNDRDEAEASARLGIRPGRLSFLWECALISGWIELADSPDRRRTWAVPGETARRWADGDDQGALHAWAAVFAAVAAGTLDIMADAAPDAARRLDFRGQGVAAAVMLFLARPSGMTTRDIRDLVRKGAIGTHPASRRRRAWDAWGRQYGDPVQQLLGALADLHAVALPRTSDGAVELTPPALWALRAQFALDKISVPLVRPPSPRMSAADLVVLSDAVSPAEIDAAFAAWLRERDPHRAATELLLYAGSAGPRGRLTAVAIARRIGISAHRAWRDAMQRAELRGYARISLSMMAADLPESTLPLVLEPDPDDLTALADDLLALACGSDDPDPDEIAVEFAEAVPAGEEGWIFGLMAQGSHPDVARLLGVLADCHPDRRVAKDARRAARSFAKNRRSAGGRRVSARIAGV